MKNLTKFAVIAQCVVVLFLAADPSRCIDVPRNFARFFVDSLATPGLDIYTFAAKFAVGCIWGHIFVAAITCYTIAAVAIMCPLSLLFIIPTIQSVMRNAGGSKVN